MLENLLQDLRYALRMMAKNPAFTFVAVLTLALGIGANTAIGTIVNAALLRGLPYTEPDRLVHLFELTPQKDFPQREASHPDFLDWQGNQAIELAAYSGATGLLLSGREQPERLQAAAVTTNFFDVLGVAPLYGRAFRNGEDDANSGRVVVLGYGVWQRLFGGDPNIVNQTITLNAAPYTVLGVLPQNFQFAPRGAAELWVTMRPNQNQRTFRFMHWVNVIGRLRPGVSFAQAQAEMRAIGQRIEEAHTDSHAGTTITLVPLQEQIVGQVKPVLLVLAGAVGFVLLIACANVANLLLARATARHREIAIRVALGATRGRLLAQFLTESLLLATLGGALGILVANWGVAALIAAIPEFQLNSMPYLRDVQIDRAMILFTLGLSLLTGIVFGLVPALQASKPELHAAIKEGGQSSVGASSSRGRRRLRDALVIVEIALALVLLVGAGLMMRSLANLLEVNPGFRTENLLTFRVALLPAKYQNAEQLLPMHTQMLERLAAIPGVESVGTVNTVPLLGGNTTRLYAESKPRPTPGEETEANLRLISSNYFQAIGVPLLEGRHFTDDDTAGSPLVVIINKTLAAQLLPGEDAVGKRLLFAGVNSQPVEIVGIVADENVNGLDSKQTGVLYEPYRQFPAAFNSFVMRTRTPPERLAAAIREEIRQLDTEASVVALQTIEEMIDNAPSTFIRRYPAFLTGIFAAVALLLAAIGIYGVISYSVTQQTRDIGVRLALGARRADILKLVIGEGLTLAGVGVGVGLVTAFAATRLLTSILFNISAADPLTYVAVAGVLLAIVLLACYLPARKAMKVDPILALRYE